MDITATNSTLTAIARRPVSYRRPTLTLGFSLLAGEWSETISARTKTRDAVLTTVSGLSPTPPAGVVLNVTNGGETSTTRDGEDTLLATILARFPRHDLVVLADLEHMVLSVVVSESTPSCTARTIAARTNRDPAP